MERRKKRCCRIICCENSFMPTIIRGGILEKNEILADEFEALRLCDLEELNQIKASERMQISRATVQRLLKTGRHKIMDALLNSKEIVLSKPKKGDTKMSHTLKIAIPTTDQVTIDEHFGHCRHFLVFTVEDKKVVSKEFLTPPEHTPGSFPNFLAAQGADVIVTGGMGQMAVNLFNQRNIEVILGARGSIDTNLNEYLDGILKSTGSSCGHDHDHGDENCAH